MVTTLLLCKKLTTELKLTRQESFEIIAHFCNIPKEKILGDGPVADEAAKACYMAGEQRKSGKPLQYIIGQWDFLGKTILCKEGVLIPREDTECLVKAGADLLPKYALDLCCGSGCVTLGLAYLCKDVMIDAVDIEPKAIELTQENAQLWGVSDRVNTICCDINKYDFNKKYDLIISNPPYIKSSQIKKLDVSVKKYEPRLALDGGEEGMDFYKSIIEAFKKNLVSGGHLLFEIGYDQKEQVMFLMEEEGYIDLFFHKDLNGNDRVVGGRLI